MGFLQQYYRNGTVYTILGGDYQQKVYLSRFTVILLKNDICSKLNVNSNNTKLWRVNVKKCEIKDQDVSTEEDIMQKLDGKEMELQELFGEYFQDELNDVNFKVSNIHIIATIPAIGSTIEPITGHPNLEYVPRRNGNLGGTLLLPDRLTSNIDEDLLEKRVILVCAPPYSGKTSLTQLIEDYLVNSSEYSTYRVIRFSTLWANDVGKLCDWEDFGESWKEIIGVDWVKWRSECNIIQSILIIDEIQKIYNHGVKKDQDSTNQDKKNRTAIEFWETVKRLIQGSLGLYIIMFGAYGYSSNPGYLSTPVDISESNSKSIYDIRYTDYELEEYVTKFCRCFNLKEHNSNIIPEFIRYIKNATAGHVGLVRHILHYTREEMKPKVNELTWNKILAYLNSNEFNETINNRRALPKFKILSNEEIKLCENVLLNKKYPYQSNDTNALNLIKSGILVIDKKYSLQFSSPILMRSFIYQNYGNEIRAKTVLTTLYDFIVKVFKAMCLESKELLQNSLGFRFEEGEETILLEQMWQKEFYRIGKRLLNGYYMSCDVGATFASDGYVNFYVDEPYNWAIEILREGKDMAGHAKKFGNKGLYKEITMYAKSIAIVNIRNKSIKVRELKKDFVHVSYSEDYGAFKIECLGKDTKIIRF
ncbi:P-loop containing nucleoside triphosphate hydrolase [Rhizophagus clarus]|uniref:P-loop containing nucleoside triphosphate hydrolase n=1 Tax=Rhizophagus clarus TaxID=94130 RepID=A0A8H3QEK1_9GLOM|nr:P-loop containing nucleoside triphosphate hydrolase [Rhizophagus clarus]